MEISLREHIEKLGFGRALLSADLTTARVGFENGIACFEPYSWFKRAKSGHRLHIAKAIPPGTKVHFLESLRYDVLPDPRIWHLFRNPIVVTQFFIMKFLAKVFNEDQQMKDMCQMQGMLDSYSNPPFSEFPFGEALTVVCVDRLTATYLQESGMAWTIPHYALSTVNQISVFCEDRD